MERLILRLVINAVAIYAAIGTGWIDGIQAESTNIWGYVALGVIFGVVNGLLRPLIKLLSFPLILLSLGLFMLVINTGLFWATGWIGQAFGVGFSVDGFLPAFLGGLIVGLVNWFLSLMAKEELKPERRRER